MHPASLRIRELEKLHERFPGEKDSEKRQNYLVGNRTPQGARIVEREREKKHRKKERLYKIRDDRLSDVNACQMTL